MDISFPLLGDSSCVGSASSSSGSGGGGGSSSGSGGGGGSGRGSGSSSSGSGHGDGVGGGIGGGGGSGRGVGDGGSRGGSINNSIEGGGSVAVVIADPPPDSDSDSDSDDEFFDALSDSHGVECQIVDLGFHFDHFDLDSESGQSSDEPELDDNNPDEFVEQNNVDEIIQSLNKKSMFLIDSITAYYHISGKEPLIFEHFLWTTGKMPYIHRHGQQLTMEEIEQNRLSRDGLGYLSMHDMEMTVATFQVHN